MKEYCMSVKENNGIQYLIFPSFEATGLVNHMFTTRIGGMSKKPYHSLNLGVKTGDKPGDIKQNFNRVLRIINSTFDRTIISNQVHGINIRVITEDNLFNANSFDNGEEGVDGLITKAKNITLVTFYADCVPMFYLDPVKKVVGLAHSGWRGTVNKIGQRMVEVMSYNYGSRAEDIMVGIGPSIGPCCYEIDKPVFEEFNKNFTYTEHFMLEANMGKWYLNLWEANRTVIKEAGVKDNNIYISNLCTSCNTDKFFSYRKESGKTGRMAAIIKLI